MSTISTVAYKGSKRRVKKLIFCSGKGVENKEN
jgi:hypothetical protein